MFIQILGTVDALMNVRPEDLVDADLHSTVIKGQVNRPGGCLHAPAYLELHAAADKRLNRLAKPRRHGRQTGRASGAEVTQGYPVTGSQGR